MNVRAHVVALRVFLIIGGSVAGFLLFQAPVRLLETRGSNLVLSLVPGHHTFMGQDASIVVVPVHGSVFRAIITPSCSSLASILALGCLASVSIPITARSAGALGAGVLVVAGGNIVRIAGSVGIGILAGRSSLVLFHDWVGGLMTFVFTLGGFVLVLYLLLPGDRPATHLTPETARAA